MEIINSAYDGICCSAKGVEMRDHNEKGFQWPMPSKLKRTFFALFLSLASCSADNNVFKQSNASIDGNGSGGAVDSTTGFRVSITPIEGVDTFIHRFGDTTTDCEVPIASKDTPTDLQCMYNIMEYDLFFYGMSIEMNIPAGFCEFVEEVPYRYYTHRPGVVPPQVTITEASGVITACTWSGVAGTIIGGYECQAPNGEATISATGQVTCAYDYSQTSLGTTAGPNCCGGTVNAIVNTEPSAPLRFDGSLLTCSESPMDYVESWPKLQGAEKYAVTRVTQLGTGGLSRRTRLPSVLSLAEERPPFRANFLHANFYDWATYVAGPSTWFTAATTPRMIAPGSDISGDPIGPASSGSYSFRCLGPAGELKHRISLYVNAWNAKEDYDAYKATGTLTATGPNRQGAAGTDCNAVATGAQSCDNFWSIDDLIRAPTAVYFGGGGNPAAHTYPQEDRRLSPP